LLWFSCCSAIVLRLDSSGSPQASFTSDWSTREWAGLGTAGTDKDRTFKRTKDLIDAMRSASLNEEIRVYLCKVFCECSQGPLHFFADSWSGVYADSTQCHSRILCPVLSKQFFLHLPCGISIRGRI
jgi:hypothetical protein